MNILRSLEQDFDGCVPDDRHLHHYRHEKIKYRRYELVCDYVLMFMTSRFASYLSQLNFKLFLITDKPGVTEKNRDVGREEAVTDADRASDGDVECTERQTEVPLLGSDESMYTLYIWSTI
jgi:hypothetical protein